MSGIGKRITAGFLLLIGIVATSVAAPTPAAAAPAVIVVNTTTDGIDVDLSDGVCQSSNGTCSLRAAIMTANAESGDQRIEFNISGSGPRTINIGSTSLPDIYDPTGRLEIDGYTQSDATPNTAADGSNAVIRIHLQGSGRSNTDYGLRLASAENTVKGLAISGFERNIAIHFETADANVIVGNFIGIDPDGDDHPDRSTTGVHLWLGPDFNQIGGPDLADRNVISGNWNQGLLIEQGTTSRNSIQNNVIGLTPGLDDDYSSVRGLDLQWGAWGNLIGGPDVDLHANIISGHQRSSGSAAIDLSHSTANNLVLNNYMGTLADGNTATSFTANSRGVLIKDNAAANFVEGNIIANTDGEAIWQRDNYNDPNFFVNNRIGVGSEGAALPNGLGVQVNGHDDIFHGNIVANTDDVGFLIVNLWANSAHVNFPAERTLGNQLTQNTFYNNDGDIDISLSGAYNGQSPHLNLNAPTITGIGNGQINGDAPCDNCTVEVYVSGRVRNNGTINTGSGSVGVGAGYIGRTTSNGSGVYSLAHGNIDVGRTVSVLAIDADGNTSEMGTRVVPSNPIGLIGNPSSSLAPLPAPERPDLPSGYVSELPAEFTCSQADGTLTWVDADAGTYYVFAVTGGSEQYLGGHTGTSLVVPDADSYRVEHWAFSGATNATCAFTSGGAVFSCTADGGTLTWGNAGASEYYVFATTGGVEQYLGGHTGTSLAVSAADSYRVEHWAGNGATNAVCEGAGIAAFACSANGGTLLWDDAGASEYYVFATSGGVEQYLGGHAGTSLNVQPADSYRVEHWQSGAQTEAVCSGAGAVVFSCSVAGGTLSWTDVGAPEYYVFATTGAAEQYLGGHVGTSLAVAAADSYRVEHWLTGNATNVVCG